MNLLGLRLLDGIDYLMLKLEDGGKHKYFKIRYPAPGSEPINHELHEVDYKTAYRDSVHNIRHLF